MSTRLSVSLSVHHIILTSVCPSVCLCVCLSLSLHVSLFTCLSVCLSHQCICLSVCPLHLSVCLRHISTAVAVIFRYPWHLSACLSLCLSCPVCLSFYPSVTCFYCEIYFCGCSHYPPVTSDSERHRYKADFTSEYSEYLRLHDSISQRMKTFSALSDKLKQATPHSSEYEVIVVNVCVCLLSVWSLVLHASWLFC